MEKVRVDKQVQTDTSITCYTPGPGSPDNDGYHHVPCHDGVRIRFKLLLGGPNGDNRIDPKKRTAICLHGLGDSLSWWEDAVFRLQAQPRYRSVVAVRPLTVASSYDVRRRAKFVRALAKHMNVLLVDVRGFGGSGRPLSREPIPDQSFMALLTCKVADMQRFTEAIRADLELSRQAQNESHSIAVSGSTALIRVVYAGLAQFGAQLQQLLTVAASAGALVELQLVGLPGDVLSIGYFGADVSTMKELRQMLRNPNSFRLDRMGCPSEATDVLVIHRLELSETGDRLRCCFDACIDEMKHEQSCLEFGVAQYQGRAMVTATLAGAEHAAAYLQRFQGWMNADGELSLGAKSQVVAVQVQARGPELKTLRSIPEVVEGTQLFQVFPLSYVSNQVTTTSATMQDFVEDIESILRYVGIPRATIVGHSMGAAIALMHAVTHPGSVERLCTSGGAPRVGQIAKANWMRQAGTREAWFNNVIRTAVSVANIDDADFHRMEAPTLLVNAIDDELTPLDGSRLLRAHLPNSLLVIPEYGGHDSFVVNDGALERVIRFMMAEDAMVFAEDLLLPEIVTGSWNLAGDRAFMRYYKCGAALAEVERAERRLRLIRNWLRDAEAEDEAYIREPGLGPGQFRRRVQEVAQRREARLARLRAEQEDMLAAVRARGLEGLLPPGTSGSPREALLAEMTKMLQAMSAPASAAVEQAGVWWRDTGKASEGLTEGKYTVDAWFRRRGGSKKHGCAWYRWDTNCVPLQMREGLSSHAIAEAADSDMFTCWWCGGPASGHEDLGPASTNEAPGFYPGLGAGRRAWKKPTVPFYVANEAESSLDDIDPLLPLAG